MIKLNTLISLENVKDQYAITEDYKVVNTENKSVLKIWVSKRGYPNVTVQAHGRSRGINIPIHKIVALAFIENKEYDLIEHKDDNKLDYRVENLKFSNKSSNGKNAFVTGCQNRNERRFVVSLISGETFIGTMKELSSKTGVSRATLYDRVYTKREATICGKPKTKRSKVLFIKELDETGQQTIESQAHA